MSLPDWLEKQIQKTERNPERPKVCEFCEANAEHMFLFKITDVLESWQVCSGCLESLHQQLMRPTSQEKQLQAPKSAYVFPASCSFCGKTVRFDQEKRVFEDSIYSIDMPYYYIQVCESCKEQLLHAVENAGRI